MTARAEPLVLLLEDEPLIAIDFEADLQNVGFDVITYPTRAAAEHWLRDYRPDLAIIDVELKDGTCEGIAVQLRGLGVPVIVHSGSLQADFASSPLGELPWYEKPTSLTDLAQAAKSLLKSQAP